MKRKSLPRALPLLAGLMSVVVAALLTLPVICQRGIGIRTRSVRGRSSAANNRPRPRSLGRFVELG